MSSKKKITHSKKTTHTKTTRFKKSQIGKAVAKRYGSKNRSY